jgi:phosphatidylethanolamine-binding protein (PEBP) family uncharacterized protein
MTSRRRSKRRGKTRRIRRQRGGNNDLLVNTGAPLPSEPVSVELNVRFQPNSVYSASETGNVLTKTNSRSQPHVEWTHPPKGVMYTFLCWDPDASWLHWLVTNATGNGPETGEVITKWAPPTPPSGQHRYIFATFQQPTKLNLPANENRQNFNIAQFVQQHSLTPVSKYKGIRVNS